MQLCLQRVAWVTAGRGDIHVLICRVESNSTQHEFAVRIHFESSRVDKPICNSRAMTAPAHMLDDLEIKRLILRTAAQDAEAFSLLYRRTSPILMGVALRITRRREMAEEVLHDAFVKVWNQAKSFDPLALQPVAWMTAIVRNRALDMVSSAEATRVESFDAGDDDDGSALDRLLDWSDANDSGDALDQARASHQLHDCLAELKPGERQAIALAYHHGLSHGELATHLQKPLGTVKSWVKRGLDSLRICMDTCAGLTR